jgi:glutaredoxin|tara:strand:+ start:1427 stop:1606 length:180 start_codon:yes stop_codon:yes gene_type:complete
MVKAWLSKEELEFVEYNISTDSERLEALTSMGYRSTPVTFFDDITVVGYNPAKLEEAIT